MSNARLSCALERLAARRTFPLHARTGACRSLFGPVDHDHVRLELAAQLDEISERDRGRWNFNFATHTPLSGRYEWDEVPAASVPPFFRDSAQDGSDPDPALGAEPLHGVGGASVGPVIPASQEKHGDSAKCRRRSCASPSPLITELFPRRKRGLSTKEPEKPGSAAAADGKPRKRSR
ncbi:cyclin dependent kinase inhibitor 1Ca [Denticeps clupeoides]|uniref:cyclin dependent kinase inhibitor 1Ca n=1 Tax=Denticeps clupeoides TaxID=299321 RepID=UPI0010A409B2|nr:cyclin-dependent kinase inhibitor 1C-like [Denticeps clupeoides]